MTPNPKEMKASKAQLEANKRWYEKNKAKILAIQAAYRKTPRGTAVRIKKDKKKQTKDPEKWAARTAVHFAVKSGKIIKPVHCVNADCMETKLQGHHYNGYAKKNWLDVIYLCTKHHIEAHKIIRLIEARNI